MLTLTSPAFSDGGTIPAVYTCEGRDISPPLAWHDPPQGTQSLVLIIDDPDAPDPKAPKLTWVHWVVYNLPPQAAALVEDAAARGLPKGSETGLNDWKRANYGGPCPPIGRHRYFHKLYALDGCWSVSTGRPRRRSRRRCKATFSRSVPHRHVSKGPIASNRQSRQRSCRLRRISARCALSTASIIPR